MADLFDMFRGFSSDQEGKPATQAAASTSARHAPQTEKKGEVSAASVGVVEKGPASPAVAETKNGKSRRAYRTISEVADELGVAAHVLRFWETKFDQLAPMKRGGGRRYYRPEDVALLHRIRGLLYDEGYTIRGVQAWFKRGGARGKDEKVVMLDVLAELEDLRKLVT